MTEIKKKLNLSALQGTPTKAQDSKTSINESQASTATTAPKEHSMAATPSTPDAKIAPASTPQAPVTKPVEVTQETPVKQGETNSALSAETTKAVEKATPTVSDDSEKRTLISLNTIKAPQVKKEEVKTVTETAEVSTETKAPITTGESKASENSEKQTTVSSENTSTSIEKELKDSVVDEAATENAVDDLDADFQALAAAAKPKEIPVDEKLVEAETKKLKGEIESDIKEKEKKAKKDIEIADDLFDNYVPKYGKEKKEKYKKNEEKIALTPTKREKGSLKPKKKIFIAVAMILCVLGMSAGGFMYFNSDTTDGIQASVIENNITQTREEVNNIIDEGDSQDEQKLENEEDDLGGGSADNEEVDEGNEDTENEDENTDEENENSGTEDVKNTKVKNYLLNNYYN